MSRGKCHRFLSGPPYGVCISQLITLKKCTTVLSLSQLIDLCLKDTKSCGLKICLRNFMTDIMISFDNFMTDIMI